MGGEALYRLGYPNREVRQSLNRVLLRRLVQDPARQTANSMRLARLLEAVDCAGLRDLFHAFFASIPELAPAGSALAQLQERDYAAKYRGADEPIHLIGVEFSRDIRNVTAFEVAAG